MKKKILTMLLAVSITAVNIVPVFAEEAVETEDAAEEMEEEDVEEEDVEEDGEEEITAVYFDEETAAYEGSWIDFEAGFSLYVPSDWNVMELTEEDSANNIIFAVTAPDESGWNMNVNYTPADDEEYTLDDLADLLDAEDAYTEIEIADVNDLEVLTFQTVENTAVGLCIMDDLGGAYTIVITGDLEDDDFVSLAFTMMSSISITEEDTEDAETEEEIEEDVSEEEAE